ncbi:MAG TPA: hypothetical protein VFY71_05160 [Planctomycetota bacterium]|nr:hypothetical protein [Planctomycetota bacterium]
MLGCVGALVARLHADVLVVDAAGGGDFTKLPAAVAAALDGDILLVRAGEYDLYLEAPVPAKSLTLLADAPTGPPLVHNINLHGLPAACTLIVRGFEVDAYDSFGYALQLENCDGALVFEDCDIAGANIGLAGIGGSPPGWPGARLNACASVTFVRCSLTGGKGADQVIGGSTSTWGPGDGGPALEAISSHVALHDCVLLGGTGGYGNYVTGANGGPGLSLTTSLALLSGSTSTGGKGGTGCLATQMPADCNGGPGLKLDASSSLQVLDASWTGGDPGQGDQGQPGLIGPPFVGPPGQPIVFAGTARSLAVSSPVREQQPGLLELDGVAGDVVFFFMSFDATSLSLPGKKGWLALAFPIFGPFALGAIGDPGGQLDIPFLAPDLASPSLEGQTFLLQGVFLGTGGTVIGSVGGFTLVDSSF